MKEEIKEKIIERLEEKIPQIKDIEDKIKIDIPKELELPKILTEEEDIKEGE